MSFRARRNVLKLLLASTLIPTSAGGRNPLPFGLCSSPSRIRVAPANPVYGPLPRRGAFDRPLRLPGDAGLFASMGVDAPLLFTARPSREALLPGRRTDLWSYASQLNGKEVLNPLLRARTGATVDVTLANALGEDTTIHWHGLHVDEANDGSGMRPVANGQRYGYRFHVANRAGTYWYHPHPHQRTGLQIHQGMSSLFLVEGPEDDALRHALGLEFGKTEIPLLVQDKQVNDRNQVLYSVGEDDWIGNQMFVNWTLEPFLDVERRHYRLRVLNACNARVLRLAFVAAKTNLPFSVIGGDGGLLERPYEVREMFIAPAQRADLLIDFGLAPPGEAVMMTSLKYDPMENDGRPGDPAAEHPGAPMMGEAFDVMRFRVGRGARKTATIPSRFEPLAVLKPAAAPQRRFRLHIDGMKWLLNGRNYYDDMHRVDFTARSGSTEVWEMRNETKSMPHPMHVHGFHFRVLSRAGSPPQVRRLAVDAAGRSPLDLGWQDTVLVWPSETVRMAVDFSTARPGTNHYMFHCHNLEHEDSGLMLNFAVSA